MTYQELNQTVSAEEFQDAVIQDLVWHKLKLRNDRRKMKFAILGMIAVVVASVAISVWSIANIKAEYAVQIETLQKALEREKAAYKNKRRLPEISPDILPIGTKRISQVKYRALSGAIGS